MKEIIKKVTIEEVCYQSEDGELFDDEYECNKHEYQLLLKDKDVFFDTSGNTCEFDDCSIAVIDSEETLLGINRLIETECIYGNIKIECDEFPKVYILDTEIIDITWIKNHLKHD